MTRHTVLLQDSSAPAASVASLQGLSTSPTPSTKRCLHEEHTGSVDGATRKRRPCSKHPEEDVSKSPQEGPALVQDQKRRKKKPHMQSASLDAAAPSAAATGSDDEDSPDEAHSPDPGTSVTGSPPGDPPTTARSPVLPSEPFVAAADGEQVAQTPLKFVLEVSCCW